jgi:hypothetical protein
LLLKPAAHRVYSIGKIKKDLISFLKEGENGPRVRDLASEATARILLVISPRIEVK